jgi:transposase
MSSGGRPHQHTLVDALGNSFSFHLTGGEAHDLVGADHLLPEMQANMLIADKAFDADQCVIELLEAAGKTAVIPPAQGQPRLTPQLRPAHLQGTPPDRELLRQDQAIPRHRHPI